MRDILSRCIYVIIVIEFMILRSENVVGDIFYVDDDFADIISSLNISFKKLNWNIKTVYCCSGHTNLNTIYDLSNSYIAFEGDIDKLERISVDYLKKMITLKEISIDKMVFDDKFLISITLIEDFPTIEQKKAFLHAKYIFQTHLWDFIDYMESLYDR